MSSDEETFGEDVPPSLEDNSLEKSQLPRDDDLSDSQNRSLIKRVLKEGDGSEKPEDEAIVIVNLTGTSPFTSEQFDSRENFEFVLGRGMFVDGFEHALCSMVVGEKAVITMEPIWAVFTGRDVYNDFGESQKQDEEEKEMAKIRVLPPRYDAIDYEVELLYVENLRGRGLRWDRKMKYANELKLSGNTYFQDKRYGIALRKYQKAVEFTYDDPSPEIMKQLEELYEEKVTKRILPKDEPLSEEEVNQYLKQRDQLKLQLELNICASRLKLKQWEDVIEAVDFIMKTDPNNIKAIFRRGQAYIGLKKYDAAKEDFKRVLELESNNKDAEKQLERIKQIRAEEKKKEKEIYRKMFSKPTIDESEEINDEPQNNDQTFIERFVTSILKPGVTSEQLKVLNWIFVALFVVILLTIFSMRDSEYFYHTFIFLFLAIATFATTQWMIFAVKDTKNEKKNQ